MTLLKLLSRLLDYPTEDLSRHSSEIRAMVSMASELSPLGRSHLQTFLEKRLAQDLLDWQSDYDGLFERGRAVSLHLFEHVHGESRDRGQAMVDLMNHYHAAGLDLGVRELPDYLPLYLEFVTTQGEAATGWLADIAHILSILAARLKERDPEYAGLVEVLLELSGVDYDLSPIMEEVRREERDDTPEALDRIWEEEAVTFNGSDVGSACESSRLKPTAAQRRDDEVLTIVDAAASVRNEPRAAEYRYSGE